MWSTCPAFIVLPLMSFSVLSAVIVMPYLAATLASVSPFSTTYSRLGLAVAITLVPTSSAGSASGVSVMPGMLSLAPALRVLPLRPFAFLSSLTETPNLLAILPSVSPLATV